MSRRHAKANVNVLFSVGSKRLPKAPKRHLTGFTLKPFKHCRTASSGRVKRNGRAIVNCGGWLQAGSFASPRHLCSPVSLRMRTRSIKNNNPPPHLNNGPGDIVCLLFLAVASSIDAQTNVKWRQACKTAMAFQGPLGFSGASYGRDASHSQGMTGRSMAARASQGYRCAPLSTESGAYLWNGSST
jgi:hypothetical protein